MADQATIDSRDYAIGPKGEWPPLVDPRFRDLLRHWVEKRDGLMMPRAAIDPVAIRHCLPNVWIYQYLPQEDDFLCTLSGEKVNQAWGGSLMGRRVSEFMSLDMSRLVPPLYRRMLALPAIQVSRRRITPAGSVEQSAERLIVPLSHADGSPYGVFGITLYFLGQLPQIANPADIQGQVTLYPCADLPAGLP